MTKCAVRFLIQFTSTDFDAAGPAQFRVRCFIVLIELVDTQEGGSEWLGKRRSPAGDSSGGPVLWSSRYAAWGWWVSERSSFSAQSRLGARILAVEQTIRRWRVGTGQHASWTQSCCAATSAGLLPSLRFHSPYQPSAKRPGRVVRVWLPPLDSRRSHCYRAIEPRASHDPRNSSASATNCSWYWKMPPCPASG
jgi:hypothetical protein